MWRRREDFAAACRLSVRVVGELERAERTNFTAETLGAVEAALGWEPGSADRVRAGLAPRRREDNDLARLRALWPRLSPGSRRMLVELAERAVKGP